MSDNLSLKKIYLTTQIPAWVQTKLSAHLTDFEILRLSSDHLLSHKWENVEGLIVRSQTQINSKFISHFKDLKIVGTATSGFDHLDLHSLNAKNIISFYTPDANVMSTADLTLLNILMVMRNNFLSVTLKKDFDWKHQIPLGSEASEKSLGILGMGRIGREVAKRALGFGFKVYYHDPYLEKSDFIDPQFESVSQQELFSQCDIISLHVPLTRETKSMINKDTLALFGNDKILVNCARGELIKTQDLLSALDKGILKYVALDTFEHEPLAQESTLKCHPQIFWTPHIGAHTQQAFEKSCLETSSVIINFFKYKVKPQNLLPPNTLWAKNL